MKKINSLVFLGKTPGCLKRKYFFNLTLLMCMCNTSVFATLVTHEWQANHRGYSIELVPGTGINSIDPEYVAAGTVFDDALVYPAWHFMHLDKNGNVISERTTRAVSTGVKTEFRVVDIVAQNENAFWITIQARRLSGGSDYIYLAGVDITGADLTVNPDIAIETNASVFMRDWHLYATHSYFSDNGSIYICGYSARASGYPNQPNSFYTTKRGMLLKCDVVTKNINYFFWNSTKPQGSSQDFDMALKIAPHEYGDEFPLLITGAANDKDDPWLSTVFVGKFDDVNGMVGGYDLHGILPMPYAVSYSEPRPTGVYGVDIRGGVYGGMDPLVIGDADKIVLVNYYNEGTSGSGSGGGEEGGEPASRTYGILRLKRDLSPFNTDIQSYMYVNDQEFAWGKQFLELHGRERREWEPNHIPVIGEQTNLYSGIGGYNCEGSLPSGAFTPSANNINPFYTMAYIGSPEWNPSSGFTSGATDDFEKAKVYLSSMGTRASNMDYLQGSLGAGALPEDIRRLYTFTSLTRFYDNPNGLQPDEPPHAMLLPIGESNATPLKSKFLHLDKYFRETSCDKYMNNCRPVETSGVYDRSDFDYPSHNLSSTNAYSLFTPLHTYNDIPSLTDCSSGQYKPTNIASGVQDKQFEIYPNPATTELILEFGNNTKGYYSFTLKDITGKIVTLTEGVINLPTTKVNLPKLSPGVYMATIQTDKTKYTRKISIQ